MIKVSAALVISVLLLANASRAHDSWISRQRILNPVTLDWCCGRGDCGVVMPAPKATAAGWVMCGRRVIGKSFFTLMQHWSGAVMCPAC